MGAGGVRSRPARCLQRRNRYRRDTDAVALYRMWYDLAEISLYVGWFRGSNDDTADAAEGWQNLQYFLRPAQHWPDLPARPAAGST